MDRLELRDRAEEPARALRDEGLSRDAADLRPALYLAPFGPLSDPHALVDVAVAAEEAGAEGVFLWDHMLRPPEETREIADVWVALAAMAAATRRIRLGPMVTPITRRRPWKLAREATTLDHLSRGRLTLGLGIGVDSGRELSAFHEIADPRVRGDRVDEGTELLCKLWSGERVRHSGPHFPVDDVSFLPRPVQRPRIPLWFGAATGAIRPVRRAARYEGLFPIHVQPDELARMLDLVRGERGSLDGFDVAVLAYPGVDLDGLAARGATWALHSFRPGESAPDVFEHLRSAAWPAAAGGRPAARSPADVWNRKTGPSGLE